MPLPHWMPFMLWWKHQILLRLASEHIWSHNSSLYVVFAVLAHDLNWHFSDHILFQGSDAFKDCSGCFPCFLPCVDCFSPSKPYRFYLHGLAWQPFAFCLGSAVFSRFCLYQFPYFKWRLLHLNVLICVSYSDCCMRGGHFSTLVPASYILRAEMVIPRLGL